MTRTHAKRRPGVSKPPSPPSSPIPLRPRLSPSTLLLLGIVAFAVALRLWRVRHGLPDFTEEAIPFRKALEMWRVDGSIDWNPHLFHYPSLTVYLQLLVQKLHYALGRLLGHYLSSADYLVSFAIDPSPMVVPARALGVAAEAWSVVSVWRIAERLRPGAGPLAALLVAASSTMILTARAIFTDTVMTALMLAALERMLAWRERGGTSRLAAAVILMGLATGAKYPAAVLTLPLAAVLGARLGPRGLAAWAVSMAGAALVFLATTPYAILDFPTFSRDLRFAGRIGVTGHLGNIEQPGFGFHLRNLAADLGWIGLALLALAAALFVMDLIRFEAGRRAARAGAVPRSVSRHAAHGPAAEPSPRLGGRAAVWLTFLSFAVPISLARVLAERYLVPVVPLAAVIVAVAARDILDRIPARFRAAGLALGGAALVAAPLVAGIRIAAVGGVTTLTEARRWCEAHLGRDEIVIQELYGPQLLTRLGSFQYQSREVFAAASPGVQARFRALPWFSSLTLPLVVVGYSSNLVRSPDGQAVEIPVFPHVSDFNQACYDPRLFEDAGYFITSSAVRGRFEADPGRYPAPNRLYALLDSTAEVAARFQRPGQLGGPEIVVYRLGPRTRSIFASHGPLDPLWWAERVPREYRRRAAAVLAAPPSDALHGPDGEPTAWVRSLTSIFETRYAGFARAMAMELVEHGRFDRARRFAAAILLALPEDIHACLLYADCSERLGAWSDARRTIERTMARLSAPSPFLSLEHARALIHDGERTRARGELEPLLTGGDPYVEGQARRLVGLLEGRIPAAPR